MTLLTELTPLQFKVVLLMAAGMTSDEIARFLNIGRNVLDTMSENIFTKTGCPTRANLVMRYVNEAEEGCYQSVRFKNTMIDIESRAKQMISGEVPLLDPEGKYHKNN